MIRLLLILLGLVGFSGYVASDDHQPSSVVVEVYECTLNDGASAEDLADFGGTDFKKFVNKNKLLLNSYLWDAVAVSPPFDEPDVRWINYFPSWGDYYSMRRTFNEKGSSLFAKFSELASCAKPRFAAGRNIGKAFPIADEKPLIVSVCNLNEGKTMQDAMSSAPKAAGTLNEVLDTNIGSSMWTNFIGVTGLDYLLVFSGETGDMVKMMDGVKDGSLLMKMAQAGVQPPSTCEVNLHHSHLMVNQQ